MDNKNKIILDLCGGTGSWSKPYKEAGYVQETLTLPSYVGLIICTMNAKPLIGARYNNDQPRYG